MNAFQCDLIVDTLESHIPQCSVDIATLVFVLSALHPDKMLSVLQYYSGEKPLELCYFLSAFITASIKGIMTVLLGGLMRLVHRAWQA